MATSPGSQCPFEDSESSLELLEMQARIAVVVMRKNPPGKVVSLLETVTRLAENIMYSPSEAKYRRIRAANDSIRTKVLGVGGGVQYLLSLGWEEGEGPDDGFFIFPATSTLEEMERGIKVLKLLITHAKTGQPPLPPHELANSLSTMQGPPQPIVPHPPPPKAPASPPPPPPPPPPPGPEEMEETASAPLLSFKAQCKALVDKIDRGQTDRLSAAAVEGSGVNRAVKLVADAPSRATEAQALLTESCEGTSFVETKLICHCNNAALKAAAGGVGDPLVDLEAVESLAGKLQESQDPPHWMRCLHFLHAASAASKRHDGLSQALKLLREGILYAKAQRLEGRQSLWPFLLQYNYGVLSLNSGVPLEALEAFACALRHARTMEGGAAQALTLHALATAYSIFGNEGAGKGCVKQANDLPHFPPGVPLDDIADRGPLPEFIPKRGVPMLRIPDLTVYGKYSCFAVPWLTEGGQVHGPASGLHGIARTKVKSHRLDPLSCLLYLKI